MPFTVLTHDPAKLPLRQLELDQRKGCIGPRAGFDQPIDPSFRCRLACGEADARLRDDLEHQLRCQRLGATKLCLQHTKVLLVYWIEQHDTSLRLLLRKWAKGHKETRWKKCP